MPAAALRRLAVGLALGALPLLAACDDIGAGSGSGADPAPGTVGEDQAVAEAQAMIDEHPAPLPDEEPDEQADGEADVPGSVG